MSARPRCWKCGHPRRRIVSLTTKRNGARVGEPKQHKPSCDCICHTDPSNLAVPERVIA